MTHSDRTLIAERIVNALLESLPEEIRSLATNVPVHYKQRPEPEVVSDGFEADILGLFTGNPHGTELSHPDPSPPQIILYLDNIWELTGGDDTVFRQEVRLTYLHELGHYFGWDEDEVAARGLD